MPFASINDQELFFEDSGGTGMPIFMLHGFLMDHSLFDHQVKALSDYRCIRFDARAFGRTKWDEKAFNLYDTVSDLSGLMDHLGIKRAVICGMSQGGYAALRMALRYPERVSALILMSTQAGVDDTESKVQYRQMRDTWCEFGPVPPLMEGLLSVLLGPKSELGMLEHWQTWLPKWQSLSKNSIFQAMNNLLERDDISQRLSHITQPTLITHGDSDFGMPLRHGQFLKTHLSHCADLVVVNGAAHAANYTHPEPVNRAMLDFLAKLPH